MGVIYTITNLVNGKLYVGKTIQPPHRRWSGHQTLAKTGNRTYLYAAMRKHGAENFSFEVIDQTDDESELSAKEVEWISRLGTTLSKVGYNCTVGGEGGSHSMSARTKMKGKIISPEHRAKLSAAGKGRKLSLEHVEKLRNRVFSEESRRKMSLNRPTFTPEQIEMYRQKGREQARPPITQESRSKCSIASKNWWDSHPEAKERMKTRHVSEETRKKCAAAARMGWETRLRIQRTARRSRVSLNPTRACKSQARESMDMFGLLHGGQSISRLVCQMGGY